MTGSDRRNYGNYSNPQLDDLLKTSETGARSAEAEAALQADSGDHHGRRAVPLRVVPPIPARRQERSSRATWTARTPAASSTRWRACTSVGDGFEVRGSKNEDNLRRTPNLEPRTCPQIDRLRRCYNRGAMKPAQHCDRVAWSCEQTGRREWASDVIRGAPC